MKKIISIIPARGGSKGLPKKNILDLCGKPLIAHSISQSLNSSLVDATYVTTDSQEIADVAKKYGASVIMRPQELASDTATSESALIDALTKIEVNEGYTPELVVFLQCTSPIRDDNDINDAIQQLIKTNADSLLSVVENHRFLWEADDAGSARSLNYDYSNRQRRQDMKPQFCENGSIYIFRAENLKKFNNRLHGKITLYIMKPESGYEIDDEIDLAVIKYILQAKKS